MKPLLFSFRRCPFAIRARMAIRISGVDVDTHEVHLRNKPQALFDCSPKGTVPVIQFPDGRVLEESLDIMHWALAINDPEQWLDDEDRMSAEASALVQENDESFKPALDLYKYSVRFPEHPESYYREQTESFLAKLESRLQDQPYLMGAHRTLPDMAIFPFIRQFYNVNQDWLRASKYQRVMQWLDGHMNSEIFNVVMQKPV